MAPTVAPSYALPSQISNDPRAVQTILAALEFQTARAAEAERQAAEWQRQAAEWQGLYSAERERAELLKGAGVDRKEAAEQAGLAVGILRAQHEEDKTEINLLRQENDKLRGSRLKWAFGGAAVGIGTCAAAAVPNMLGR